jgi:hypothetical protein
LFYARPLARLVAPLLFALLPLACQSGRRTSDLDQGRDPYLIKAEELEASSRSNLYDAIFEIRPRWFTRQARANTGDAYVYVDEQLLGTIGTLRRFLPSQVAEVRYLAPTEAQVQFGQKNQGRAAIVVVPLRD